MRRVATHIAFLLAIGLAHCSEPTQILVTVRTNVAFQPGDSVGVVADLPDAVETGAYQVIVQEPWSDDGFVGTLAVVPPSSDARSSRVGLRIVLARGRDPSTCTIEDAASCVIARRAVSYLPNTPLRVNVFLWHACEGKPCSRTTTCNMGGICVSRDLSSANCADEAGCVIEGDPTSEFGGVRPPGAEGGPDAVAMADAPTDATSVVPNDAAPEASGPDGAIPDASGDSGSDTGSTYDGGGDGGPARCGGQPGSPWPMAGRCSDRRALATAAATTTGMTQRWSRVVSAGATTPVIAADGTLYTCDGGSLRALSPSNGSERWSYSVGNCTGAPAVGADGTIYVAGAGGNLHAVTPVGGLRWSSPTGFYGPVILAPDDTVYVRSTGSVRAINPMTGAVLRTLNIGPTSSSSPAVAADGTVYVIGANPSFVPTLYAFSATGASLWTRGLNGGSGTNGAPMVGPDGTVYVAVATGMLAALNPSDGSERWSVNVGSTPESFALGPDGNIYFCSSGTPARQVGSVTPMGVARWSVGYGIEGCYLSVDPSSNVLVTGRITGGGPDIRMLAGASGMLVWSRGIGGGSDAPTVGADGTLYSVLGNAGAFALYALAPAP